MEAEPITYNVERKMYENNIKKINKVETTCNKRHELTRWKNGGEEHGRKENKKEEVMEQKSKLRMASNHHLWNKTGGGNGREGEKL